MSVLARFFFNFSKRSVNALVRDPQEYLESFSCSLAFFSAYVSVLKRDCGKLLTYACRMALPLQVIYAISF